MYLPYLNTTQIGVKSDGKCLKVSLETLFRIVNYLLRLKISLARWDEHDEKFTRLTSDLTGQYERASGFFEA